VVTRNRPYPAGTGPSPANTSERPGGGGGGGGGNATSNDPTRGHREFNDHNCDTGAGVPHADKNTDPNPAPTPAVKHCRSAFANCTNHPFPGGPTATHDPGTTTPEPEPAAPATNRPPEPSGPRADNANSCSPTPGACQYCAHSRNPTPPSPTEPTPAPAPDGAGVGAGAGPRVSKHHVLPVATDPIASPCACVG
jgi:hypothetical protein